MKKLILICTFVFLGFSSRAQVGMGMVGSGRQVDLEVIQMVEKLQTDLQKAEAPQSVRCEVAPGTKCQFTILCDQLRPNRNAEVLYRNPEGEVLHNLSLYQLQGGVDQCRFSITDKDIKNPMQAVEELQKGYLLRRKAFLDSVALNGEYQTVNKIESAMIERSLADSQSLQTFTMLDREKAEKNIREAEAKLGLNLNDETRAKWVAANSFEADKFPKPTNQNPFFDSTLLVQADRAGSKEKVVANQQMFQKEIERVYNIFLDTKKEMIAVLNKRRNGNNNAQIDSLIKRIETISYAEPNMKFLASGSCPSPNAFYDFMSHQFTICPQMLQAPSATLQMIIAHELGHSIDPCIATYPLQELKGEAKPNQKDMMLDNVLNSMKSNKDFIEFTPKLPKQEDRHYASFNEELVNQMGAFKYKSYTRTTVAEPVKLSENPFATVIECLQGPNSVRARMGDIEGARANIYSNIKELKASGADENHPQIQDLRGTLERLDSVYVEKQACGYMGSDRGPSQMQEAFSDWLASEVMASKVEQATEAGNTEKARRISFESNGFFASMNCESFSLDIAAQALSVLHRAGCLNRGSQFEKDLMNMQKHEDVHPESHARASKIFMAHPTLVGALGCTKPRGVKRCE